MKRFTTKILSFAMVMAVFCQNIQAQTCVTITEPAAVLSASSVVTAVKCKGGSSGAITITGSGGTSPYTYSTDGLTFVAAGTPTFSNLVAGNYSIRTKDAGGCIITTALSVTEPATLPTVTIAATENSCKANDNKLTTSGIFTMTATATGGTPAGAAPFYTYSWSHPLGSTNVGVATVTATTTYTISVTDANNCSTSASVTATLITEPTAAITGLNLAYCKDASAVTLTGTPAVIAPATGTFTIDAAAATSFNPTTLAAGSHSVIYTYTDEDGCSNSATKAVTVNDLPSFTLASTNVKCNGANDGTITITAAAGGATPYEYSKDDGVSYIVPAVATTTYQFTGLTPTTYKPSVKDANGCVKKCQ